MRSGEQVSDVPGASDPTGPRLPETATRENGNGDCQEVSVLIVDDVPVFRSAAIAVIRSAPGFSLAGEASCGEEAIELVAKYAPDLVLLDVRMPELDGVATARRIAEVGRAPITVLMSADEHPDISADPRVHGADAFLLKQELGAHALRELWATHSAPLAARD